jgi:hypothetical protein
MNLNRLNFYIISILFLSCAPKGEKIHSEMTANHFIEFSNTKPYKIEFYLSDEFLEGNAIQWGVLVSVKYRDTLNNWISISVPDYINNFSYLERMKRNHDMMPHMAGYCDDIEDQKIEFEYIEGCLSSCSKHDSIFMLFNGSNRIQDVPLTIMYEGNLKVGNEIINTCLKHMKIEEKR